MNYFKEDMDGILSYCEQIENQKHRNKFIHLLHWVQNEFGLIPNYEYCIPNFYDKNLIITFITLKEGILVTVDGKSITKLAKEVTLSNYELGEHTLTIKWTQTIDFNLLTKIIEFEIKANKKIKTLSSKLPLKIEYSHDAFPEDYYLGLLNFSVEYDANQDVYIGAGWNGEFTIDADKVREWIKQYRLINWRRDYYNVGEFYIQVFDGDWWNLDLTYKGYKFSSRGGCDYNPRCLANFENEILSLQLRKNIVQLPEAFEKSCEKIESSTDHDRLHQLLHMIKITFELQMCSLRNQLAFTKDHKFVIGFQIYKDYFSIMLEKDALETFRDEFVKLGYTFNINACHIRWNQDLNFELLTKVINYKMDEKQECSDFWKEQPLKIIVNYNAPFPSLDNLLIELEYHPNLDTYFGTIRTKYGTYNVAVDAKDVVAIIEQNQVLTWKSTYLAKDGAINEDVYWEVTFEYKDNNFNSRGDLKVYPRKFKYFKKAIIDISEDGIQSTKNSYYFENPHASLLFSMIKDKFSE